MIALIGTIFGTTFETAAFPLADGGDAFGLIIFILFILISFLSRLPQMLNNKDAQKKPVNRRPPLQRPAGGAAQRPQAQQAPAQRQAGLQPPPQRRPLGDLAKQPVAAAIPVAIPAALPSERPVGPLGQALPSALDQRLTQHVQAAFDHEVGSMAENESDHVGTIRDHEIGLLPDQQQIYEASELRDYAGSADQATADSAIAQELLALLKTRTGIRNAILLGEILRRPEDRWAL